MSILVRNATGFPEMRGTGGVNSDVHNSSSDSDSSGRVSFEVVRLMLEVSNDHFACLYFASWLHNRVYAVCVLEVL
jgi:hypothetical protein